MKREEIIKILKDTYSREVRKGLVRTILDKEKIEDELEIKNQYKLINQIFSYVLQQYGWEMGEESSKWDSKPLEIMIEVFPKLNKSKWYKEQLLTTNRRIKVDIQDK